MTNLDNLNKEELISLKLQTERKRNNAEGMVKDWLNSDLNAIDEKLQEMGALNTRRTTSRRRSSRRRR